MAGFPGLLCAVDGTLYIDSEVMDLTLAAISRHGCSTLIILTEEGELPEGSFDALRRGASDKGLTLTFLPVVDYEVPGEAAMRKWRSQSGNVHGVLAAGGAIACACQHGAGRSGLLTALVLIEQGMEPEEAMCLVRGHYDKAIESEMQETWVRARKPGQR